jgi:hypothetical protein
MEVSMEVNGIEGEDMNEIIFKTMIKSFFQGNISCGQSDGLAYIVNILNGMQESFLEVIFEREYYLREEIIDCVRYKCLNYVGHHSVAMLLANKAGFKIFMKLIEIKISRT